MCEASLPPPSRYSRFTPKWRGGPQGDVSLGARGERRAQAWKRGCGRPRREPQSPGTRSPGGERRRAPLQAAPSTGASRGRSRPGQGERGFPQKVGTRLRSRPPPPAGTPLPLPAPRYPHLPPRVTEGRAAPSPPPGVDPVPAEAELPAGASLPSAGAEQPRSPRGGRCDRRPRPRPSHRPGVGPGGRKPSPPSGPRVR